MSHEHYEIAKGNLKSYVIGFCLSIILTIIPFALVMTAALPVLYIVIAILIFAILQIMVHVVFFLHLHIASSQYWNWTALIYTVILIAIIVGASIWIMYHLNLNM